VHFRRAQALWRLGEIGQAIADLSSAIAINKGEASYWQERAYLQAFRRQWREAAADLGRSLELQPNNLLQWRRQAALLLRAGDEMGYKQFCHKLLDRFGKTSQGAVASHLALACTLGPLASEDAATLAALAPRTTRTMPKYGLGQLARGAASLRLGQDQQAVAALTEAQRLLQDGTSENRLACLYLALASEHMGQKDKAVAWHSKAETMRAPIPDPSDKIPLALWLPPWWIDLECEVLAQERARLPQ
jgi:tetratricopeptide (TPR) repeat protein